MSTNPPYKVWKPVVVSKHRKRKRVYKPNEYKKTSYKGFTIQLRPCKGGTHFYVVEMFEATCFTSMEMVTTQLDKYILKTEYGK